MSWFINLIGTGPGLKSQIEANRTLSPLLKAALVEILGDPNFENDKTNNAFSIKGNGHSGHGSSISSLQVERIQIHQTPTS